MCVFFLEEDKWQRKIPFEPDSAALYPGMCACKSLLVCVPKGTQMCTRVFQIVFAYGCMCICS